MKGPIVVLFICFISVSLGIPGLLDQWINKPPDRLPEGAPRPQRECVFCPVASTECTYLESEINHYRESKGLSRLQCHNVAREIAELKTKDQELTSDTKCGTKALFHSWKSDKYSCGNECAPMDSKKVLKCHLDNHIVNRIKTVWEISVGANEDEDFEEYVRIWKNSPGHEAAMVKPEFQFIGCHEPYKEKWVNCEFIQLFNPVNFG